MIYYVEALVKAIIVVLAACLFFRIFEQKSEPKMWKRVIYITGGVLGLFFVNFIPNYLSWLQIASSMVVLATAMFFYRSLDFRKTLYLIFFYYAFVLILGKVSYLLLLLFPLVLLFKKMMHRRPSMYALHNEWLAFGLMPAFCIFLLVYSESGANPSMWHDTILFLGICLCNLALFYIFSDLITKQNLLVKERILNSTLKRELEEYATIDKALEQQRSRSHEFKNYINCIYYLLEMKKYDELEKFVHSVRSQMHAKNEAIYHTGNLLADAIFNAKYKEALAKEIDFKLETDSLEGLCVKDEDIVVIFSNLLNNALEAAVKCSDNRYIHVAIKRTAEGLHINAENSHCNSIIGQEESLQTSKEEDVACHGFGIANMKKSAARYDGKVDIFYTDKKFRVDIFLHTKESLI